MECIRIPVKPLSANEAYKFNRNGYMYKSKAYHQFAKTVSDFLSVHHLEIPPEGPLFFKANFGVQRTDLDNCQKPFLDILEKVYNFNDKRIDEIHIKKHRVPKQCEYIEFGICLLDDILPISFDTNNCIRKILEEHHVEETV